MVRRVAAVAVVCLLFVAGCAGASGGVPDVEAGDGGGPTGTVTGTPADAGPNGTLEVHFINVGQADATLVIAPSGETMLIDSGDWTDDGETVIAYLEAQGVDRIDHLVATHNHADHVGGHAAVIRHFETEKDGVGAVYDNGVPSTSQTYERYLDAVEEHEVPLFEVREGDRIEFAGVDVTVFNPPEGTTADDHHENAIAVRLAFGDVAFLFTGDAEAATEERMRETHGDALAADVLQAGHHGSRTSSAEGFLGAVDPTVAVVSSDYDSQYGHPHEETLARLGAAGVDAYWTATHGTVVMETDGETLRVATQHAAPTEPTELRDGAAATADPTEPAERRDTYGADAPRLDAGSPVARQHPRASTP